ncbi:MAG TPA: (2Fe-2S)-binding protein [Gemmata sp.]|nr:(2Fe-2S)-binding protein [Gemmata sp.]
MNLDDKVCYCFHVSRRKLVNWVRLHRPKVASQLSECGSAGTGCGWCIPFLKLIHRRGTAENAAVGEDAALDNLSPEEYAALRAEYVKAGMGTPPPGAEPLPEGEGELLG